MNEMPQENIPVMIVFVHFMRDVSLSLWVFSANPVTSPRRPGQTTQPTPLPAPQTRHNTQPAPATLPVLGQLQQPGLSQL